MTGFNISRFLGIVYIVFGLAIFFLFAWELLFRISLAAIGLYIVLKGLTMQGYPMSRFVFMAQRWRSRF